MTETPISLQDLRERIYIKTKADKTWRFWGLYVHVCKMETLYKAYVMAWKNDGASGIDGVAFKDIEESGEQEFLEKLREELVSETYRPAPNRKKEIPKGGGKFRTLGMPFPRLLHLLKLILKAGGKRGVPQGGPISPLLANLYRNGVDEMLEKAKAVTMATRILSMPVSPTTWRRSLMVTPAGSGSWKWRTRDSSNSFFKERLAVCY